MGATRTWKLIHLTDLHLRSSAAYVDDDKIGTDVAHRSNLVKRMCTILDAEGVLGTVDAILVTGDITNQGEPAGHQEFQNDLFPRLRKHVGNAAAVCVVPGNHDVAWGGDSTSGSYYTDKFASFEAMTRAAGVTTCLFPRQGAPATELVYEGEPVYLDADKELLVLCINSAIRCGEVNRKQRLQVDEPIEKAIRSLTAIADGTSDQNVSHGLRHIELDLIAIRKAVARLTLFDIAQGLESQLAALGTRLAELRRVHSARWDQFLKVAILHHHLLPFPDKAVEHKPFDLMLDSASLLGLLESYGFQLALTGHQHQAYDLRIPRLADDLLILGGTTVGGYPARGKAAPEGFRYLTIHRKPHTIEVSFPTISLLEAAAIDPQRHVSSYLEANRVDDQHALDYQPHKNEHRLARVLRRVQANGGQPPVATIVSATAQLPPDKRTEMMAGRTEDAARSSSWVEYVYLRQVLEDLLEPSKGDPSNRVNRVYAIDHFDPMIWAEPPAYYWLALQARQYVKQNYLSRNGSQDPGRGPLVERHWEIQFSQPILDGVTRSLENMGSVASATHFDDLEDGKPPYRPTPGVPSCEVARILVWERDWLRGEYVKHLVASHSAFNIPLYFVDKRWALDNGIRLDVEYLLLGRETDSEKTWQGNLRGTVWYAPHEKVKYAAIKNCPVQPFEHFYKLLACPDLLFAADASRLIDDGKWDAYLRRPPRT